MGIYRHTWWSRFRKWITEADAVPARDFTDEDHPDYYWIGPRPDELFTGTCCQSVVGAVFLTHPDLIDLDPVLQAIFEDR